MKDILQELVKKRMKRLSLKGDQPAGHEVTGNCLYQKKRLLEKRGANLVKVMARGKIEKVIERNEQKDILYRLHWTYAIAQNGKFYLEEEVERRKTGLKGEQVLYDEEIIVRPSIIDQSFVHAGTGEQQERKPIDYDRRSAVRYAERWWNSFNPEYPQFDDDCTNYISQCLYAGGIPMWGEPVRTRGWWIRGKQTWSYSWSVANAFETMLKGVAWTREVDGPKELTLGDIICYDFEGDGRFNHNTIVTGKDAEGYPLVNAHTTNSRQRYWAYEDSTAYTPNIQYRFFHIITN